MSFTIDKDEFQTLLKLTQRPQNLEGKSNFQVNACMLTVAYPKIYTCSLVKDGLSSVSMFSTNINSTASPRDDDTIIKSSNANIPVTDIKNLLGVLNYHGGSLTISHKEDNKLVIKSRSKQTTITSNSKALAFPHSPVSLQEWSNKSIEIIGKIGSGGSYMTKDGNQLEAFASFNGLDTTTLFEALRCVNVNGQKTNEFTFISDTDGLKVITGKELKGQTEYKIETYSSQPFTATFGGGLDNILKDVTKPNVNLHFLNLTSYNQGIKMIMEFDTDNIIFQSSIGEVIV